MKLAAAARQLNMALSTVALLSRNSELEVDSETDTSGARFFTRASVQACWVAHQEEKKKRGASEPVVPVAEVTRFTGHSTAELLDLIKAGVLHQLPGRCQVLLTAASLGAWITDWNIDQAG